MPEKDTEGKTCFECAEKHLSIVMSNLKESLIDPSKRKDKIKVMFDNCIEAERHLEKNLDLVAKIRPIRKEIEEEHWGRGEAKITPEQINAVRQEIKAEGEKRIKSLGKVFITLGERMLEKEFPPPSPKPPTPEPSPEPTDEELRRYYALRAQRKNNVNKPPIRKLLDGIRPNFLEVVQPYRRRYRNA